MALLGVLAAVMGLTGCQHLRNIGGSCHDTKPYMKARSIAPLKIPPGLDTPDSSNALKIPDGAWLPLVLGGFLVLLMWTWSRGSQILTVKTRNDSIPLTDLIDILKARAPHRAPGTAIFLTSMFWSMAVLTWAGHCATSGSAGTAPTS